MAYKSLLTALVLLGMSHAALAVPITYNYSNGELPNNTFLDGHSFGDGEYNLLARSFSFTLDEGETSIGSAFVSGLINQAQSGSGTGTFTFNNVPITINSVTQYYSLPVTYNYQIDPFVGSDFTFASLPEVMFDLGADGILMGEWSADPYTVKCGATASCGGGVVPFIKFTRLATEVPEPSILTLMCLGLAGIGLARRKKTA